MDIKVHSLTILHTLLLLHLYICICVSEDLQETLIHQGIIDFDCITLIAKSYSIQAFLSQLEVQLCIDYGNTGNHVLIKVQVSIIPRQEMCYLDTLLDHIGQWNPSHPSHKLEARTMASIIFAKLIL